MLTINLSSKTLKFALYSIFSLTHIITFLTHKNAIWAILSHFTAISIVLLSTNQLKQQLINIVNHSSIIIIYHYHQSYSITFYLSILFYSSEIPLKRPYLPYITFLHQTNIIIFLKQKIQYKANLSILIGYILNDIWNITIQ